MTSLRERVLEVRLFGRSCRELVYPWYVRAYPYLFGVQHFEFEGRRYRYMFHPYGATIRGERVVEIPIAWVEVQRRRGQRILEVGNVLRHYFECTHDVVDKYEAANGCVNVDILEFEPEAPYDFIVSISTVEHIGWNAYEKEPERAVLALRRMKGLLRPGGGMLVTMPWGANPVIDAYLQSPACLFDRMCYMRRTSRRNTWIQADASATSGARYWQPYPFGNVLILGYVDGDQRPVSSAEGVGHALRRKTTRG